MKLLIVLHHRFELWNAPPWLAEKLSRDFPNVQITHLPNYDGIETELSDADAAIAWSLRPEQIKTAKKLRWIHSPAAAVHQLLFPELINSDIILTNARDVHGPVVAEHVIALTLALAKKIPQSVRLQVRHEWGQQALWDDKPPVREISGATLGLLGFGSIGRETAQRANALGMRVIAVREHPQKGSEGLAAVYGPSDLDRMLAESDYVVLCAPLTPQTTGIISAERLRRMKRDACLINVGRGPLVDEAALADALRNRTIAAAALDVFSREPLPADSPFWDLENCLVTPHTAAITEKLWDRHYIQISENLRRFLSGQPLLGIVDKRKGY
ncbi:MAG TPA: D-2-hydroxyacid dehydrogenase [Terriglobales bacterium]|nr:D-2-hydroxyacid dehydrogenase [Terriglobales bacterium]